MAEQIYKNASQYAVIVVMGAVIFLAIIVWPFWNLIPNEITETTKLVYKSSTGKCVIET